jgi:tol-pal system protein YbgF
MKKYLKYSVLWICFLLPYQANAFDFIGNETNSSKGSDRIERLERSLSILEKQVYRNNSSDKPYKQEVEYSGNNITIRISEIESKLRELTGQIEESEFNRRKQSAKIEKFINEVNFRLGQIEKSVGVNTGANFTPITPTDNSNKQAEDGTRSLGTLPVESIEDSHNVGPKYEYNQAFAMLRQAKYSQAAEAFHNFITKYPQHNLLSNAYYWLGETFYVQKDYEQASVAFLQGYQTNVTSSKAPDNLLKLAISLGALNKKNESCATFKKLEKEFPNAPKAIRKKADKESDRIGC